MPRPVLQYCSLPFNWHRSRYSSILLQVTGNRLCPNRTRSHAALCREAGRLVSRSPKGEESGSGKPPGRKPHMVPAAISQHVARIRCISAA